MNSAVAPAPVPSRLSGRHCRGLGPGPGPGVRGGAARRDRRPDRAWLRSTFPGGIDKPVSAAEHRTTPSCWRSK